MLVVCDAFNGVRLWKQPLADYGQLYFEDLYIRKSRLKNGSRMRTLNGEANRKARYRWCRKNLVF